MTAKLGLFTLEEATERYKLSAERNLFKQRMPTIDRGDPNKKMEEIRQYVHATYELLEKVFQTLNTEEAFYVDPIHKLRHPMIFYYGHTAAFYINKLCTAGLTTRINPKLEEMFAIGVDEMSWDNIHKIHYNWPSVAEVSEYRRAVRDRINEMMESGKYALHLPLTIEQSAANDHNAFWWVMLMGAEHERIHIETASVHVRELPIELVSTSMSSFWNRFNETSGKAATAEAAPTNKLVSVSGGQVQLGRRPDSAVYGWDCDYSDGNNFIEVKPFKASLYLVSNAEFYTFVKAGGYKTQRYWDEEGWRWVQTKKPTHPWFWVADHLDNEKFSLRLQTELIDMEWSWPCEMNHHEARAFCSYKSEQLGKKVRMPTEAEWMRLYDLNVKKDQPEWDSEPPGNLNLEMYRSSCPVDRFRQGDFFDVVGNVWQHCETAVYPYPGFEVQKFYDDFSQPTFDGRHMCIKGGCWVSTGNEATRDARFAFRRHFFQYVGLRYVEGEADTVQHKCLNPSELDIEVDGITDSCFREEFEGIPNGCARVAEFAKSTFQKYAKVAPEKALDFACGAGRVTFEMTSMFNQVVGSDFTARRLIPAFALLERGKCEYTTPPSHSELRVAHTVDGSQFSWYGTRERASFYQADPANLPPHMSGFSLIICWNCLERSHSPSIVPSHMLSRLEKGGLLIIGGDFTWELKHSDLSSKAGNRYASDPLVLSRSNPHDEIFQLLGGDSAVEFVSNTQIPIVYPSTEKCASIRCMNLRAYLKK